MSRNVIIALFLMALVAVFLIFNTNVRIDVDLVFNTIKSIRASLVYLVFIVLGVLIGVLLH